MAIFWLDLVRFADTTGLPQRQSRRHLPVSRLCDPRRSTPTSRSTGSRSSSSPATWSTAPTEETRIASGYNRLLQTTQEGGAQAKEYMAKYSADRVRNVSTVWLGSDHGLLPSATTTSTTRSQPASSTAWRRSSPTSRRRSSACKSRPRFRLQSKRASSKRLDEADRAAQGDQEAVRTAETQQAGRAGEATGGAAEADSDDAGLDQRSSRG